MSGLVYVSDAEPGISRRRCGRGFTYIAPDGTTIARGAERQRIDALAVPPAYDDVWICPIERGHLQATGRDERRRKQYRYHQEWSETKARQKFDDLPDFGRALPAIRRRVRADLKATPGSIDFALAAATRLIDRGALRVGDRAYTADNGSYGAVTLQSRHLKPAPDGVLLDYKAKGGHHVQKTIHDRVLQKALEKCDDLPGATLFTWVGDDGEVRALTSQALNAYLADAQAETALTAKTFRTWAGTVAAFDVAARGGATIKDMSQAAATRLHNTATVARNSYIHPAVIDLAGGPKLTTQAAEVGELRVIERELLSFLENR